MAGCVQIAGQGSRRLRFVHFRRVFHRAVILMVVVVVDPCPALPLSVPVLMPASGADLLMTTGEHHILFDVSHSCIHKIISTPLGK